MHEGATLGRRFTALRQESHDVPGVQRWTAQDTRRNVEVTLDILESLAPTAVRKAAVRAAQVRDARFARVLASGRENVDGERLTYVVTERPRGTDVAALASTRIVPATVAASIVGEAARALEAAATLGIHHGYLRPRALTVTRGGRVVVAGLDSDGELATQAGLGRGRTEQADAVALARVFLTLVTGMDADQVTVRNLPDDLTLAQANVARAAVAGNGPSTLSEVADAMGLPDAGALRALHSNAAGFALVAGDAAAHVAAPPPAADTPTIAVDPEAVARAAQVAQAAVIADVASAQVAQELAGAHVDASALDESLASPTSPTSPEPPPGRESADDLRRRKPQPLDPWDDIVEDQNAGEVPSLWEALLGRLHRQWPGQTALAAAYERAHERSQRSGPINAGPLVLGVFVVAVIVVGLVAYSLLRSPLDIDDSHNNPPPQYPEFTPSPTPSASPSGGEPADE